MMRKLVVILSILISLVVLGELKVALLVNGTLGDGSFFDLAAEGVKKAEKDFDLSVKIIEMFHNPSIWEPTLKDVADSDYDVVIVGTWQMAKILEKIAPLHPEKKFILFDAAVDYSKGNLGNVYSILYKQNEGSFLVGALASLLTTSGIEKTDPEPLIGFLGGMDTPTINDFLVGYIQGAKYVNPDVKVLIMYAGVFHDPAKGKEMGLVMYKMGADIVFNVAGITGIGLLESSKEADKYAIGVDYDQALMYERKDPEVAKHIVTSMLKRVDLSIYRALKLHLEGKLQYGRVEKLGVADEMVGFAKNKYYLSIVPENIREKLDEMERKIENGEIVVKSFFGMSKEEFEELKRSVNPLK